MQWYYSKNGTQLGPVPQAELISKLASGEITTADLVWREGMGDWLPAGQIAELKSISAPIPAAYAEPSSPYAAPSSPYAPPVVSGAAIPTYLWQAIVVTLLCCLPFGVVSIIYAAKVNSLKQIGDLAAAQTASANAKKWALIGLVSGIVIGIGSFVISFLSAAAANPQLHP